LQRPGIVLNICAAVSKALVIAEKPSVAADIARALGGFTKHNDYYESDEYVLSSAIGHLLELAVPEEYEVKRGKWSFAHLPVLPPHFDLKPLEKNESRLKLLVRLAKRKDVTSLINACDAGREGELIFRYIVQHAGTRKPISRLWLQSMTPAAVREGFKRLRSDEEMQPLANAAVCRSESDWLVGINGTRAMTAFNSKSGGFHLTTVGRVQTPTLAILVEREERIKNFKPRSYWEVHATFEAQKGDYIGRWFDEQFAKEAAEHRAERIWEEDKARALKAKCAGKEGVVEDESKSTSQLSPLLYDLTSLQREANGRYGFSAKATLGLAQALYEKHKVITYPRTDSRALPEDYVSEVNAALETLARTHYGAFAKQVMKQGWVRPSKRVFNNAKVSDHFAIIPTSLSAKRLSEPEAKLYDLVVKRFLAIFYPAAEHLVTTRVTRVEGEGFKSEGKVLVDAGWLAVYGKEAQPDDTPALPAIAPREKVLTRSLEVQANQTKPPARFSEATLLSAMESAGKTIEDEELREAMREKGLGTPATRAAIIEGLIYEKYVHREGKELQPTAKAFSLIALLRGLGIPELCMPELTGDWEFKLKQMEHGKLSRESFMEDIKRMTRHIVEQAKRHESDTVPGEFATLKAPCPHCGGVVKENYKKFQCESCDFSLWRIVAGKQLEAHEVETLLTRRKVGPLNGFRSKKGRPFSAVLALSPDLALTFDFGPSETEPPLKQTDLSKEQQVGTCPKCGGTVYELDAVYACENAVTRKRSCDFRSGKVILQRPIEREQFVKLLTEGRTDLLHRFISKKGRPFSAYLVKNGDGKVGFEFAPRGKPEADKPKVKTAALREPKRRAARS
jgi:DNA topoisomerase-3